MTETRELDVYWAVHNGQRWSVSLSEGEAWQSLQHLADYEEDPRGWTVEQTHETVPLSFGEIVEGQGECIVLDDENYSETLKQSYNAIHVFWDCPLCGRSHNNSLYDDPVNQTGPAPNPSIWFCEHGKGIVLVLWQEASPPGQ